MKELDTKKGEVFQRIKSEVAKIPLGKVANYGLIAKRVGIENPRVVGWAIRNNQDKNVPCHRVVMKNGSLAKNFSLGGWQEQKFRLEKEGIEFVGVDFEGVPIVDLEKHLWD